MAEVKRETLQELLQYLAEISEEKDVARLAKALSLIQNKKPEELYVNIEKLTDKVKKLEHRYRWFWLHGVPVMLETVCAFNDAGGELVSFLLKQLEKITDGDARWSFAQNTVPYFATATEYNLLRFRELIAAHTELGKSKPGLSQYYHFRFLNDGDIIAAEKKAKTIMHTI